MELGNLFILLLTTAIVSGSGVCSVRGDGTVEEIIQKGNQLLQSAVKEVTDAFKFSCPDDTKPLLLTCTGPEVVRSGMVEKVANCGYGSFNSEWPKYCCSDFLDFPPTWHGFWCTKLTPEIQVDQITREQFNHYMEVYRRRQRQQRESE